MSSPAVRRARAEVGMSGELEELIVQLVTDGFTAYCCGTKSDPVALVACYRWPGHVDVMSTRDLRDVTAARLPRPGGVEVDIFNPRTAVWAYRGEAEHALRALTTLVHPLHPDAPTVEFPAPAVLRIERREQRPMSIRVPAPGSATARATRLADQMASYLDATGNSSSDANVVEN